MLWNFSYHFIGLTFINEFLNLKLNYRYYIGFTFFVKAQCFYLPVLYFIGSPLSCYTSAGALLI